jgi:hypothetical protein
MKNGMYYAFHHAEPSFLPPFTIGQFLGAHFFLNVLTKLPINKLMAKLFRLPGSGMVESDRCFCMLSVAGNIAW